MVVRRQHLAKSSISTPVARRERPLTPLVSKLHAHGCVRCGRRYTDGCKLPEDNGTCLSCRTGRERPLWDRDMDPRSCCLDSRRMDTPEVVRYALGGPGPWYQCSTCHRTHPFMPREDAS